MGELDVERVARVRDKLREWGTYGPMNPEGTLFGWRRFPVDDLSDEAVMELAKEIGLKEGLRS